MNGDEKEEASRPRPLSSGIWTLFSWLRRNERSSSSESLSSVGSARTAVSFDFLAPGNCNFKKPIVLTAPDSPPSETYKKRLQDRNLRRQRDRDITLHRKYGLFREYGNGYDGFSLPPARRVIGSTIDRQDRDRRATSECLQRRAAYVPGKRRAPLPPIPFTSASLPRSYKRKRPAPKPPVKLTIKERNNQQIIHPEGMNTNHASNDTLTPENELLMCSKNKKCDKKDTVAKDTKSKSDKSFLKHIFENRKRNSVIETSSLRLLPSISELDKQAAEIIENNKLRRNNFILDNNLNTALDSASDMSYEGNSWFCTSCLKKYSSSVKSCNVCTDVKKSSINIKEKYGIKSLSPRSSIYTQTINNTEIASSSQTADERKILKDILKEMKDSLPKKYKDNNSVTETPTLRIGSTVPETFKDFSAQPSSSNDNRRNSITKETENNAVTSTNVHSLTSLSSYLEQKNHNRTYNTSSSAKSSDQLIKNVIQHNVSLSYNQQNHEHKNNDQSASPKHSVKTQDKPSLSIKDQHKEKVKTNLLNFPEHSNLKVDKILIDKDNGVNNTEHVKVFRKLTQNTNSDINKNALLPYVNNSQNKSNRQNQLSSFSVKTNETKENIDNPLVTNNMPNIVTNNTPNIIHHRESFFKEQIHQKTTNNGQNQVLPSSLAKSNDSESTKIQPSSYKLPLQQIPTANSVVVNSVTVVTSHSNEIAPNIPKELSAKIAESQSKHPSTSKILKQSQSTKTSFGTKAVENDTEINATKCLEASITAVKPESNLHIPLKISSLLNPIYSSKLPVIKENKSTGPDNNKQHEEQCNSKNFQNIVIKETENKQKVKDVICRSNSHRTIDNNSSEKTIIEADNDLKETSQKKETVVMDSKIISETPKALSDQIALPSTSGFISGVTKNNINKDKLGHYNQRRHLINQLEQSIARGDEAAAADAASKLAKLRLSCSVLSFSSQIMEESSNQGVSEQSIHLKEIPSTQSQSKKPSDQIKCSKEKEVETENIVIKENKANSKIEKNKIVPEERAAKLDVNNESNKKPSDAPSSSTQAVTDDIVPIDVWVEDKQAARGPIRLRISRRATMADLRRQAEQSFGLATRLQRWIVGRTLCTDNSATVVSLAGPDFKAPFYLCLVQSEICDKAENEVINKEDEINLNGDFYTELIKLEQQALVQNIEPFECGVCMEECAAGAGVVLRECIHTFCRECLSDVVQHCQDPVVACPAVECSGILQQREIRTIVSPDEYERWLARSLATAECGNRNTFHCRTRDCTGWAFCDPGVRRFPCPVCKHTNCVQCQAIHEGETCEQYQAKLREAVTAAETNKDDEGTQALLTSLISRGEALECPECKAIITKKWGCDWVKCSACKTEICWITKGRRWGPGGRGDTSGGCRCGVDGQRCHPSCGYCH